VVIGGEESDQAEGKATDGLGETEAIEAGPRWGCCWQFWRNRRLLAAGWRPGGVGGRGHGAGAETVGGGSFHRCHRCHNTVGKELRKRPSPACQWLPVAVDISSLGAIIESKNPYPLPCPENLPSE
jgi:hypothetical protein